MTNFSTGAGSGDQESAGELRSIEPTGRWEVAAVLATVLLADVTLYRGHGYAGLAVFFLGALVTLYFGKRRRQPNLSLWIVAGMQALLAVRLVWYGSPLQAAIGFALVIAFATALDGHKPFILTVLAMASQSVVAGCRVLWEHLSMLRDVAPRLQRGSGLSVVLPALAFLVFSTVFILANPDAVAFVGRQLAHLLSAVSEWFIRAALRPTELLFWIAVAWITAGLLRPLLELPPADTFTKPAKEVPTAEAALYCAYRNTLVTVICLFAGYLVYEYRTLWAREFPLGFYYAGYAHEGAAWLTVALALATLTLSLVFSKQIRDDPRLPRLQLLAWIWSLQNLLLSMAVYNRLFIYIDFNGLTRMRIVGVFGISVVVVGFLLVVWKIAKGRDSAWLVQRQVWALAVAVYLFSLTPVDGIAASYNVRRIVNNDLSASMQIGVQQLDLEGTMCLLPLLDCATPQIREGVAALIAGKYLELRIEHNQRQRMGWTACQFSDRIALERFATTRSRWKPYENGAQRKAAIRRFYEFAYQWY